MIGYRRHKGQMEVLIKWMDYPLSESTWEPVDNFTGKPELKTMLSECQSKYGK